MSRILPQQRVTGIGQPLDLVRASDDSKPRIGASRGGSQLSTTPFSGSRRPCPRALQHAFGDVSLKLSIPGRGIELGEPDAEFGEVVFRKQADGILDLLDSAHRTRLSPAATGGNAFLGQCCTTIEVFGLNAIEMSGSMDPSRSSAEEVCVESRIDMSQHERDILRPFRGQTAFVPSIDPPS